MATITVPIWKPVAKYAVKAALTSRFREELDEVANNRKGSTSRIFTLVVLYPDNTNTADQNAVAVMTQQAPPRMLGYLPREVAAEYRQRMAQAGYEHMVSACEAVLSGGLVTTDKVYDYILEVDLDMSIDPHPDHLVTHPEMVRHTADPEFKKDTDGAYRFKCWIPHDAVGHLHPNSAPRVGPRTPGPRSTTTLATRRASAWVSRCFRCPSPSTRESSAKSQ
ncbi:hypothetical protein A7X97_07385 [Stenotrophomonas sepilia]|uniref:HIRAN domain-containing protein n=1 Tax=Stenotrophomonas sepilia TaxID=2860290 RepID=UPI000DA979D8|nr:HIRAN domain-containing protein [Stenotrophomonas sepilia]PZT39426.1 hypothetical protein A7X97_07385 [Stenotrophomonas sepilia]